MVGRSRPAPDARPEYRPRLGHRAPTPRTAWVCARHRDEAGAHGAIPELPYAAVPPAGLAASDERECATIQMVEVWIPMLDGRWLMLPRHTQPEKDVQAMLDHIQITLPAQPPPRIKAAQVALLAPPEAADQPSLW